ncbi:Pkinase-domain-containing protein [Metschnikowia bicuspidata var. bicuspidata NRRL YB-4993]|uniref:Pkinase-domain-containing protein n=1 Tax=Metschnikowia bicuspidata var. bicuspidata NRRL YB-4993 TaxID=869754 RepID=A0A1A0HDV7_9ASCO|nr:Pkinase-domain-containing protein [Metschnikowia bicuspidata var. bicuspidata NRRL YB-4993]OBA22165.1 Pkinase-domain-containing protein [Metschnikowia bicuspidata var. bicuspidata NRRL YB-4993]
MEHGLPAPAAGPTKEKALPPIPPAGEPLIPPMSLRRKNVKQLSFSPAAHTPLGLQISKDFEIDPQAPDYSRELGRLAALKTQPRKKHPRPAPLVNIAHAPAQTSPQDLIDSFHHLDLSSRTPDMAPPPPLVPRQRRTVISLLSPTKLPLSGLPLPRPAALGLPGPDSPLAATLGSLNLRDEDLVHLKDLGLGNSGVVLKVLHVPLQKTMARKVVLVDSKLAVQTQIIRELRIMHECRSPYIIEFYAAFLRANNSIVLCMEYLNCGSLDHIVQLCTPRQFPRPVLQKLLFLILCGLTYLYDTHRILHRDIKPSNVLMSHRGDFKLCDFGVSRELASSLAMADTFVGTSTYMLPERIQGLAYGLKSDVWSMGLMLVELASGRGVWSDDGPDGSRHTGPEGILDLLQRIVNEDSPLLTNKTDPVLRAAYDPALCAFIDLCLVKDDKLRHSPDALLRHPFLAGVAQGACDKDVKAWAKHIRKLHKEKCDHQ